MVRPFPFESHSHSHSLPLAIGLLASIFALVALCAKRGTKSPKHYDNDLYEISEKPPKSPLATPRRILTNTISNLKGNNGDNKKKGEESDHMVGGDKAAFGEGGLWQKNILMGEKCQPLDFSGVIYYDDRGNRISEIPRSPRASAAGLSTSFSFPVPSDDHSS